MLVIFVAAKPGGDVARIDLTQRIKDARASEMSAVPSNGHCEPSKYERAAALLSPEAREALIAVSARVGIGEDDPLYSVLLAQIE
jgi:hypothetical protein